MEWIIPPSVRVCVPLLGEAQNLGFCTILSEISQNHLCILQYLATVALKTQVLQPRSRALEVEEAQNLTESMEILWEKDTFRNIWGGRVNHGLEAPPGMLEAAKKPVYNTLATLFHEPGHTCLLFGLICPI